MNKDKVADLFVIGSALWLVTASVYFASGALLLGALWSGNSLLYAVLAVYWKYGNVFRRHTHVWRQDFDYGYGWTSDFCAHKGCRARRMVDPDGTIHRTV